MRVVPKAIPPDTRLPSVSRRVLPALLLGVAGAHGQEALRTALEADRSLDARQAPGAWPDEGFHAGPVRFEVGAAFSAEWNDNVNISENDPQQDFVLRPLANLRALWPITDSMRLNVGAGIGYTVYVDGTRENRLLLTPDSEIAFDVAIHDVVITVYNQIDYSDDLAAEGGLSDAGGDYARITNTAGVRAAWEHLDWRFQAGYSHFNYWSLSDSFSELDRASHQFFARVGYALAAATQAGVETSGSITDYVEPLRSDFHSVSLGPFVEWSFTEDLQVRLRGGYVIYDFEEQPIGPSLGTLNSYYLGLNVEHTLTDFLSHRLGVTREVRVGTSSEYEEQFRVDYGARWALLEAVSVSAGIFYENTRAPQRIEDERFQRVGFSGGAGYQLTSQLSTGLSYRFTRRDSDLAGRDYTQHSVTLNLAYRF